MTERLIHAAACAAGLALVASVAGCSGTFGDDRASPGSDEGETRVVEHARGTTDVPDDPQRVVVLEPVQLDTAVALDVIPVGAAVLDGTQSVPAYLGQDAGSIQPVGTVTEPSLEKIAELRPDLILGTESRHSLLYDKLSAIAPTVFMATQEDPWQDNVGLVADALGDPEGADQLLDAYQDRCAEVAEEHQTAGMTAQLVRPRDGILTLYGPSSFAGSTLECAGFTTPPRDWERSISVDVSPELATQARADLVVVTSPDPEDPSTVPADLSRVVPDAQPVDESFWITGVGPLGGQVVLDDLDRILDQR